MNNKIDKSTISNGGTVSHHSRDEVQVRVPPFKATGNLPEEKKIVGLAKASPDFKPIEAKIPVDEKRAVAEATTVVPQEEKLPVPVKTVENKTKLND